MKMLPTITFNLQPQTPTIMTSSHKYEHNNPQILPIQVSPFQQIPKPLPLPPPTKFIGTYVIDYNREIGHGNFSHVYVALDQKQPNTKLAVKVVNVEILREQKLENLIKSEAQILLAMRHENIIYCKDVLWDNNYCYIFTQFCEGGSLETKIKKAGFMQKAVTDSHSHFQHMNGGGENQVPNVQQWQMLPLIKDIFQAMVYLEKCHIIHRDIKAANIFIKENRAIVADFGFARYVNEPFYDLNIGSLPFMPPQALSANLYCNTTDVWAFGCLLYEIFHGEAPYAKSHDIKELVQKAYIPLRINNIRPDLSTQMKDLILTCLQIQMDKRKKFTDIEKMWFYRNLFENLNPYNNYRLKLNSAKMIDTIKINGKPVQRTTMQRTNTQGVYFNPQNKLTYRLQNGTRPFASRFKQKVHNGGYQSRSMNYSDSGSVGEQVQVTQSQNYEISQKNELALTSGSSNSSKVQTPIKITLQIPSLSDRKETQPVLEEIQKKSPPEEKKQQKISFKDVLLRIQEVRNYYKLAVTLKDRNKRVTQIKNRLFLRAVKQINKIEKLIQNQEVDFTVYDKTKQKRKPKDGQKQPINSLGIANRKSKLTSIIKDYKNQFQNQLKRRELKANININGSSKGFPEFLKKNSFEENHMDENGKESTGTHKNDNSKLNKVPTLTQDIEYVVQTELIYHAEDSLQMSYQQCQVYRTKIKEILEDIMHLEHGYLGLASLSQKKSNQITIQPKNEQVLPSEFSTSQKLGFDPQMDDISRLRWKQKSNYDRIA